MMGELALDTEEEGTAEASAATASASRAMAALCMHMYVVGLKKGVGRGRISTLARYESNHTRDAPPNAAEQRLEVVGQHLGHGGLDGHAQGVHLPREGEAGLT